MLKLFAEYWGIIAIPLVILFLMRPPGWLKKYNGPRR